MSLLLIWENVPENTKAFVLEGREADLACLSAGVYINSDDTEGHAIEELNELLEGRPSLDVDKPIKGPFDEVVICGFIM